MALSPALRLHDKYEPTLKGRKVGVLLAPGYSANLKKELVAAIIESGAAAAIIAPKVGGVEDDSGTKHTADMALNTAPSVVFDAVAILAGTAGDKALAANPDAVSFLMDADRHLKAILLAGVPALSTKAHVTGAVGVTEAADSLGVATFIETAKKGKVWAREV